jgi:predicted N-acetyltransferase YhbS
MPALTTDLTIAIREAAEVSPAERRELHAFWDQTFPQPAGEVRSPDFAEPTTVSLLLRGDDGRLIGACRLRERTIVVAGRPIDVAGLASVAIAEAHRGRGHGAWLVQLATDTARVRDYSWSVLFCSLPRQTFYRRLGWRTLEGDLLVGPPAAAQPIDPTDTVVMALPLTRAAAEQWPVWRAAHVVLPNYW